MTESVDAQAKRIFDEAIDVRGARREAILAQGCGQNTALRSRVESLLSAAEREDEFLSDPTVHTSGAPSRAHPRPGGEDEERAGSSIGAYRIIEKIGEGGFGAVFRAEQTEPLRRQVALKIVKLGMDTRSVVARFEQERQALALMDHANIAKVFDAGATASGRPYFVMELVKGEPITKFSDGVRLSIPERLELFTQVCRAVQHAHTKGVIHRDIKPSNVLVSVIDGRPVAKVIDFGIAKATQQRLTERTLFTEFRQFVGTPEYMSPEQASGNLDVDTRTDVYSLGVLLYELLAGATPFAPERLRSAALDEIQRIIREVDPPAPSTHISQMKETAATVASLRRTEARTLGALVRGELDWIVMRALEKDRGRRYQSAGDFAADVDRFLAGQAVDAAPPSAAYRLRKFVRRNRLAVLAASAVAGALIVGLGLATAGLVRARAAEAEARLAAERSETVALFVTEMLRGVQPAVAQGRDTSIIREMLDKTVARIDKGEFEGNPVVEADIRHLVGVVFGDLGLYERAVEMQRESLRLRIQTDGEESDDATLSMNDLGKALWLNEEYQEALGVLRKALDIRVKQLGNDHPYVGISMNNLGMLLKETGDYDGAEKMLLGSLAIRRKHSGERSIDSATALGNLAMVEFNRGDYRDAERYGREALAINREAAGNRSPITAGTMSNLGRILDADKRHVEAEPLHRESLEVRRAVFDPSHPNLTLGMENLAWCLHRQILAGAQGEKRAALDGEALALFEEALGLVRARARPLASDAARVLQAIGALHTTMERFADGERVFLEAEQLMAPTADAAPSARRTAGHGDAINDLVKFYERWEAAEPGAGHAAQAATWRARLPERAAPPK